MGRTPTIDAELGARLIREYQRLGSQTMAAKALGVSQSAANRFFRDLPKEAAPLAARQQEIVAGAVAIFQDARALLEQNYARVLIVLAALEPHVSPDLDADAGVLCAYVAAVREGREHIRVAVDVARMLVDVDAIQTFQTAALEAIGAADPATRARIIAELRTRAPAGRWALDP